MIDTKALRWGSARSGRAKASSLPRLGLAIVLALSATPARSDDHRESAFRGKRIAEANCAVCHAIGGHDASTLAGAPPFRDIGARIEPGQLREILRGAVFLEHAAMPDFQPSDDQAVDLATYIHSIAAP